MQLSNGSFHMVNVEHHSDLCEGQVKLLERDQWVFVELDGMLVDVDLVSFEMMSAAQMLNLGA